MRFYGTIRTNLGKLCKEYDIEDIGYSVDGLMFETKEGETFDIDFEEGDYALEESYISFRLKSLGISFEEGWDKLEGRTGGIDFENDYHFFRQAVLRSINVYVPEHPKVTDEFLSKLKFKVLECYLQLAGGEVYYKPNKVEVE